MKGNITPPSPQFTRFLFLLCFPISSFIFISRGTTLMGFAVEFGKNFDGLDIYTTYSFGLQADLEIQRFGECLKLGYKQSLLEPSD